MLSHGWHFAHEPVIGGCWSQELKALGQCRYFICRSFNKALPIEKRQQVHSASGRYEFINEICGRHVKSLFSNSSFSEPFAVNPRFIYGAHLPKLHDLRWPVIFGSLFKLKLSRQRFAVDPPILVVFSKHAFFEEYRLISPLLLSFVQGNIGSAEQVLRARCLRCEGGAKRNSHTSQIKANARVLELPPCNRGTKLVAEGHHLVARPPLQDQSELLTAASRNECPFRSGRTKDASDRNKNLIPYGVAVAVIHLLEMINIGQDQSGQWKRHRATVDVRQLLIKSTTVG